MKAMSLCVALLLLAGTGSLLAQGYAPYYYESRAATPAESYARGMADVARSAGQYNLATSAAAINVTEAQRNYIQNRDEWTNTYFQMRQANRAYRAAERGPKPSMEDLVRYAQAGKPKRLSPSELDTVSGGITWPTLLRTDAYSEGREQLESLFAQRAEAGVLTADAYLKVKQVTGKMLEDLKGQVWDVPQTDYIAAKNFLQSLAYAASQPPG